MLARLHPARLSYRMRLLAATAVAGLPLLLLAVTGLWQYRLAAEAEVARDRVSLAQASALDVQAFLADTEAEALMLALDPLVRAPAPAPELEALLWRVQQAPPAWRSVGVFGADGWNLALTEAPPHTINHSTRAYFRRVLATAEPAVGPAPMPGQDRQLAPVVGVPVQFTSGEMGVLTVAPSTTQLSAHLSAQGAPSGVQVFVIDGAGALFASSQPLPPSAQSGPWRSVTDAVLAGQTGSRRVRDASGTEWLAAYAPVPNAGWGVVIAQPAWAAFAAVDRQIVAALAAILATLALATIVGWVLGGRLSTFYERAVQATNLRDAVLASVSHDLQNPLQGIKGQAQLLQTRLRRGGLPDREELGEALARIDRVTSRMSGMIGELLDAATLHAGQSLHLRTRPSDLVDLVAALVREQQLVAGGSRIRVTAEVDELVVHGDPIRLQRVLGNLLSNALKYSAPQTEVWVELARESDWAVIRVRDQGLGIPAADLPHIFEYFHRARNVTGRVVGTGLGLAGARQIVAQHGGSITVQSQQGVGSTFTVRLPLVTTPRDLQREGRPEARAGAGLGSA